MKRFGVIICLALLLSTLTVSAPTQGVVPVVGVPTAQAYSILDCADGFFNPGCMLIMIVMYNLEGIWDGTFVPGGQNF